MVKSRNIDRQPDVEEVQTAHSGDEALTVSRRTVLRRSALGLTGIGVAALLAACGNENDEEDEALEGAAEEEDLDEEPIVEDDAGDEAVDDDEDEVDAMDSLPLDPDSAAIDDETDIVETEVVEDEET